MKRSILSAVFAVILVFTVAFLIAPKANAASITLQDGETLNITKDAILDLAGNSGSVHVAEGVKLSVIDSGNKSVTGANAGKLTVLSGEVEAEAEDAAGRRFLKLQNADGSFSFHPFYVTIKQVGINTNKGTLCLQAMFVTNEIAQKAVSTGIVYGEGELTENAPTNGIFAFKDGVMYAYYDLMGSFANQAAMEKVKSFRAYFAVGEAPIYSKTIVTISPLETLNTVSERFATFSDYQQSTMMKMIENNPQLQELPAVTEILRLTALSADKQTVQEMNEALTYVRAESFGAAKESLREYGFGEDDNFVPKTEGHSFRWLAAENVVLLVDEKDRVVYPAAYVGDTIIDTTDIRMCFDLSLPAAKVAKNENKGTEINAVALKVFDSAGTEVDSAIMTYLAQTTKYGREMVMGQLSQLVATKTGMQRVVFDSVLNKLSAYADPAEDNGKSAEEIKNIIKSEIENQSFAEKYTFVPATDKASEKYKDWITDFYISFTKTVEQDGKMVQVVADYEDIRNIKLGGFFKGWKFSGIGDDLETPGEEWLVLSVENLLDKDAYQEHGNAIPLVYELLDNGGVMTYTMACAHVSNEFKCGIIDDGHTGITMTVEMRLTEPVEENPEIKVVGIYNYTFQ